MKTLLCAGLALVTLAGCSGRSGELDALMRSEPSLTRLERQLEWTLAAADAGPELASEQSRWHERLQDCLDDEDPARCAADAHRERLGDLQARFGLDPRSVSVHAAGQMGFEFRAVGNEPGWNLLVSNERCIWETDYGQTTHEFEPSEAELAGETRTYRARLDGVELRIQVEPGPCSDDMSGESFEWRVTLEYDGRTWRGCGDRTGN